MSGTRLELDKLTESWNLPKELFPADELIAKRLIELCQLLDKTFVESPFRHKAVIHYPIENGEFNLMIFNEHGGHGDYNVQKCHLPLFTFLEQNFSPLDVTEKPSFCSCLQKDSLIKFKLEQIESLFASLEKYNLERSEIKQSQKLAEVHPHLRARLDVYHAQLLEKVKAVSNLKEALNGNEAAAKKATEDLAVLRSGSLKKQIHQGIVEDWNEANKVNGLAEEENAVPRKQHPSVRKFIAKINNPEEKIYASDQGSCPAFFAKGNKEDKGKEPEFALQEVVASSEPNRIIMVP